MNTLSLDKKTLILSQIVEGLSIRSIERLTGVHRDTIIRLMIWAGDIASNILDVEMSSLDIKRLQVDEIWTYVGKKQNHLKATDSNDLGDQYVFVALDPDTKLIPAFRVGKRTAFTASSFLYDLKTRIRTRFQLSTDAFAGYRQAVKINFGNDIDFATVHKSFSSEVTEREHRYSPACIVSMNIIPVAGNPDRRYISTSLVERQNLTMRMNMRRFTRLTNAFSKKLESLQAALAIHFFYYNFMRIHQTLKVTPAIQAQITNHIWTWSELLNYNQLKQAA